MATRRQAFEWSAKAHACSAKEMTMTSVLPIARALFRVVDHKNRPCSFQVMGKSSCSVRTRSQTVAKPYQFVRECPFHDDWKSRDTSRCVFRWGVGAGGGGGGEGAPYPRARREEVFFFPPLVVHVLLVPATRECQVVTLRREWRGVCLLSLCWPV